GLATTTAVQFGAQPAASLKIRSDGALVAVSPPGTGTVDITVTNPTATSAVVPVDRFIYNPGATVTVAKYTYNGDSLRTAKIIGTTTLSYAWQTKGDLPTLLSDGTASYLYGPGGLPIESIDSTGNATFFHHDQLGS